MSAQTPYFGVEPLANGLFYDGGIYQFWYTPVSNIETWPAIDPESQELVTEPSLITGATWLGPISTMRIPDRLTSYTETQERSKAGPFYKQKLSCFHPGNDRRSQGNLWNHGQDQYIIIAEMRAGGFYMVLGHPEAGMEFDHEYNSGEGSLAVAGSKFTFTTDSVFKAHVLATFSEAPATAPGGVTLPGTGGGSTDPEDNETEIIEFTNQSSVTFAWTGARQLRFGLFPHIEVWLQESGFLYKAQVDIRVDQSPPNQTQYTIYPGGSASGFIVLK